MNEWACWGALTTLSAASLAFILVLQKDVIKRQWASFRANSCFGGAGNRQDQNPILSQEPPTQSPDGEFIPINVSPGVTQGVFVRQPEDPEPKGDGGYYFQRDPQGFDWGNDNIGHLFLYIRCHDSRGSAVDGGCWLKQKPLDSSPSRPECSSGASSTLMAKEPETSFPSSPTYPVSNPQGGGSSSNTAGDAKSPVPHPSDLLKGLSAKRFDSLPENTVSEASREIDGRTVNIRFTKLSYESVVSREFKSIAERAFGDSSPPKAGDIIFYRDNKSPNNWEKCTFTGSYWMFDLRDPNL